MSVQSKLIKSPDCPFLGLIDDPKTSLAYANTANRCFRCQKTAIPTLKHQTNYCLSKQYHACTVFNQLETQPFPKSLRYVGQLPINKKWLWGWMAISLTAILLAASLWFRVFSPKLISQGWPLKMMGVQITVMPTLTWPTLTLQPSTSTLTPQPFTHTPDNTATSTPTQTHALDVPIKVDDFQLLIHSVRTGEQLIFLARDYNTSIDAIKSINYMFQDSVWDGSTIVIPTNLSTIDPAMPAFSTYKISELQTTIDKLAKKIDVDPTLLKYFNNCPDECELFFGDWLIIPHFKK